MKCLICYKVLDQSEKDYHTKCLKRVFGLKEIPAFNIDEKKLAQYAREIIGVKRAIAGVQPKLSLWLEHNSKNTRFTVVDDRSNYIIKPQSEQYTALPENEDLCMHLAEDVFGIPTAVHALVRLPSGKLSYITKRFDRTDKGKLACEDLCQLTENLTEHKYRSSYELVGDTIKKYSSRLGLDALTFFQLVVFSFITGNADMHLKNFSLLENEEGLFVMSPAYDLVSSILVLNDKDEIALNLNGRKRNLYKKAFDHLAESLALPQKPVTKFYESLPELQEKSKWWIDNSFLPDEQKEKLKQILADRVKLF